MTTDEKGAIAETAIVHAAVELGIGVYRPVQEGLRADLVLEVGRDLLRVQCKWAIRRGAIITFHCSSSRRGPTGMIRRCYTADEIDGFAAYCKELRKCYFVPIESFPRRSAFSLRLGETRNNQRAGVNWATDFEFAATLGRRLGP